MSALFRTYKRLLQQYPIVSQCVQCGILMGSGDLIAQTVVERKKLQNINFERTAQFACVGFLIVVSLFIVFVLRCFSVVFLGSFVDCVVSFVR